MKHRPEKHTHLQLAADMAPRANSIASWDFASYVPLLVPILLFIVSLYIRPTINFDSGYGFLALRNMLDGGAFNVVPVPDPADIANDRATFLSWWTPGQYVVPGAFVWLGTDYGLAASLTALIATLVGVVGWVQVARSFNVTPFALLLFASGLVTFRHVTLPFQTYNGGEVLLFAVAPWSLHGMRWTVDKSAATCFAISLLAAALLFFAKLTGLVVFGANVLAISLLEAMRQHRVTSAVLAMWTASAIGAVLFMVFWHARGEVPAGVSGFAFNWPAIWFPLTGAVLSGVSGLDLLSWLLPHASDLLVATYVLGPLSLLLMAWIWLRVRDTRYRAMGVCLFVVIAFYVTLVAALYFRGAPISLHERHLRYAGILLFLLLLVAIDQWRPPLKALGPLLVGAFAVYGLTSYAVSARELARERFYDPPSGTSQQIVSPVVLEHLRLEMLRHHWRHPIAVLPSTEAAIGLPGFRIIVIPQDFPIPEMMAGQTWAGRADKIFVVLQGNTLGAGKAEALLKFFLDYEFGRWSQTQMDGMIVYSQ